MFTELIGVRCKCRRELKEADFPLGWPVEVTPTARTTTGLLLFSNHSEAARAGSAAGWEMVSESVGGDLCPACLAAER